MIVFVETIVRLIAALSLNKSMAFWPVSLCYCVSYVYVSLGSRFYKVVQLHKRVWWANYISS